MNRFRLTSLSIINLSLGELLHALQAACRLSRPKRFDWLNDEVEGRGLARGWPPQLSIREGTIYSM